MTTAPRSAASLKARATASATARATAKATVAKTRAARLAAKAAGKTVPKKKVVKKVTSTATKRTATLNGHRVTTEENVKLGRNKPYSREDRPRLALDDYLDSAVLPKPHAIVDRASKVNVWPMYGNDTIGDCTCAAVGHVIQAWTAFAGTEATIPESAVLTAYEAVSGYDPVTGANDNGAAEQDVLEYWRTTGVGGHKILAYAELRDLGNLTLAKTAVDLFGSLYLGIEVPESCMEQFQAGEPWDVVPGSPIEGGHAVPVQYWGTNERGEIGVITWGKLQRMTRAFWDSYVEEAWVIITKDWLDAKGETIEGFDLAQLEADFKALTGSSLR